MPLLPSSKDSELKILQDADHYLDQDCRTCQEKQDKNKCNPTTHSHTQSDYELVLPKNEWKFMQRIRKWEQDMGFQTPLLWMKILNISLYHIIALSWLTYNLYVGIFPKWQTALFCSFLSNLSGIGVTAGVHRYWCHRSFKAKLPLQVLMLFCYTLAGQNTVPDWVRDHRVHHKYSETSADPHNARRGFFFSHVGWLMMKKHPEVIRQGRKIDMSDINNDPLVQFHTKYFTISVVLICFVLPTLIPLLWNESWNNAILYLPFIRYLYVLNGTWSVNSVAHLWGNKPYDKNIMPVENWAVSIVSIGEGWHNYHHTFPWDYKASELPYKINVTTFLLDMFSKIGWVYDMKTASPSLIQSTIVKRGVEFNK